MLILCDMFNHPPLLYLSYGQYHSLTIK